MTAPKWNADGEPENLEAAALDAVEWLEVLQKQSHFQPENIRRLQRCIEEIKKRIK